MIPKNLITSSFGNQQKRENVEIMCEESRKKYFDSSWTILHFDETNFDVNQYEYTRIAYQKGLYSFVADFVRFWALYTYGGVYLDTDVLMLKSFDDSLLTHKCFVGTCISTKDIDTNLEKLSLGVFGAEKHSSFVKDLLEYFLNETNEEKISLENLLVMKAISKELRKRKLKTSDCYVMTSPIELVDLTVYPYDYFTCTYYKTDELKCSNNSYCIHLYASSWCKSTMKNRALKRITSRLEFLENSSNKTTFIDRQNHHSKLLIVLAGYKEVLWNKAFDRLIKYIDKDIDVCVVSSGIYSETLVKICENNNWSYLSTKINNLCLAQNECIERFPDAQYIFKMDEDMFVTKDVFKKLYDNYIKCKNESYFVPSAIVPLINVNCITYQMILKHYNLIEQFEKEVGFKPYVTNGLHHHKEVLESPEMSKFMWSHINIDECKIDDVVIVSPGRFSIGLIMFERSIWEEFERFPVDLTNEKEYRRIGLGEDEKRICNFAMSHTKPLMIDCSICVGHLAYGPQTKEMIEFFKQNETIFS